MAIIASYPHGAPPVISGFTGSISTAIGLNGGDSCQVNSLLAGGSAARASPRTCYRQWSYWLSAYSEPLNRPLVIFPVQHT